jgi:hypothetical protein
MRRIAARLFTGMVVGALLFAAGSPAQAVADHVALGQQGLAGGVNPILSNVPGPPQWTGLVTDPEGNPVPDVQFVGSQSAVTGPDGRYLTTLESPLPDFFGDFVPPPSTGLAVVYVSVPESGLPPSPSTWSCHLPAESAARCSVRLVLRSWGLR